MTYQVPSLRMFDPAADALSDEDALTAIIAAYEAVQRASLEQRQILLELGFTAEHEVCRDLDNWSTRHDIDQARQQRADIRKVAAATATAATRPTVVKRAPS